MSSWGAEGGPRVPPTEPRRCVLPACVSGSAGGGPGGRTAAGPGRAQRPRLRRPLVAIQPMKAPKTASANSALAPNSTSVE